MCSKESFPAVYEIRIEGVLGEMWASWFNGLSIVTHIDEADPSHAITTLSGPITDQPALHGVLNKIRDLNLVLISVLRVE